MGQAEKKEAGGPFVKVLSVESWEGGVRKDVDTPNPSWSAVEAAIFRLDGLQRSALALQTGGRAMMVIGGGAGRYVAHILTATGARKELVGLAPTDDKVRLMVGGHWAMVPRRLLVDIRTLLRAARRFTETGEMEPSLQWADG